MDKSELYCPGCMEMLGEGEAVCPYCGFSVGDPPYIEGALPEDYVLHKRYRIVLAVKRGGFSIVYTAIDLREDMPVAIKEYFPDPIARRSDKNDRVIAERADIEEYEHGLDDFLVEARLMEKLNNYPGTVSLLDFFLENGSAYIAMPLLRGRDIAEELTASGAIPFHQALHMLLPAMEALHNMHLRGYVHGDISPSNIFLETTGRVKLIDLGSMRKVGYTGRSPHIKSGYTPPELYMAELPVYPSADVYSMAATLYRMITLILPQDALDRLSLDALLPPSEHDVRIPAEAEKALMRALNVQSDERFEDMAQFMDAILPLEETETDGE